MTLLSTNPKYYYCQPGPFVGGGGGVQRGSGACDGSRQHARTGHCEIVEFRLPEAAEQGTS